MKLWGMIILVLSALALAAVVAQPTEAPEEPRFTAEKELIRPEGYREWIFVGASLGMSYNEAAPKQPTFHNVYLHPRAYREFVKTGRFPEGWAYFNFIRPGQSAAPTAKAFPKEACWKCHQEHAASDNVFTQFYPVLRQEWK